jgi:RNA polymerase sigma-70 factor, ECF subfamily
MEPKCDNMAGHSDGDLIRLAREDISLFEPLYEKYFAYVFRFIYSKMERSEDASDITGDVFLKAMRALNTYKVTGASFLSWLLVIARNEVAGFYRRKGAERRYYAHQEGIEQIARDTEYEVPQAFFHVRNLLECLPEHDFELIDLKYFHRKSVREISEITGLNENRIRVRLHRIRERLARVAKRRGMADMLYSSLSVTLMALLYHILTRIS